MRHTLHSRGVSRPPRFARRSCRRPFDGADDRQRRDHLRLRVVDVPTPPGSSWSFRTSARVRSSCSPYFRSRRPSLLVTVERGRSGRLGGFRCSRLPRWPLTAGKHRGPLMRPSTRRLRRHRAPSPRDLGTDLGTAGKPSNGLEPLTPSLPFRHARASATTFSRKPKDLARRHDPRVVARGRDYVPFMFPQTRPRPVKWCTRLSASSSPELYAAAGMAITPSSSSRGPASALAIDSALM